MAEQEKLARVQQLLMLDLIEDEICEAEPDGDDQKSPNPDPIDTITEDRLVMAIYSSINTNDRLPKARSYDGTILLAIHLDAEDLL